MNFDYMKNAPDFAQLYNYCSEAEEFAISRPNISVTAARKAMEYVVKLIFWWAAGEQQGMTVYEMTSDPRFIQYVNDEILLRSIHYIRKMGNLAVHEGNMTAEDSVSVLEQCDGNQNTQQYTMTGYMDCMLEDQLAVRGIRIA